MTNFELIRKKLGFTSQQDIAAALGMSQPNISKLENGQEVQPEVARQLIAIAAERDIPLSFDEIYSDAESRAA
jgi:transcriptional regulator with XRE-family HTH domain